LFSIVERYAQHLEAALIEGDVDYAKTVVKLLVEARKQQHNFSIKFADSNHSTAKNYFRCTKMYCIVFMYGEVQYM